MSSSSKNKIGLTFFEREQETPITNVFGLKEELGDYYGEISNSVVSFRSLSKKIYLLKEIDDDKNLIQEILRKELGSDFK